MKLTTKDLKQIIQEELNSVLNESEDCMTDKLQRLLYTEDPKNWVTASELILVMAEHYPECKEAYQELLFSAIFNGMDHQQALWDEHYGSHSPERNEWIKATSAISDALDKLKGIDKDEWEEGDGFGEPPEGMPFQEGKEVNESVDDWSSIHKDKREGIEHAVEIMASIDPDVEQQIEQEALKLAISGIRYGLKSTLDNAIKSMTKETASQYGFEEDNEWAVKQRIEIQQGYKKDLAVPYQMIQAFNGTQEEVNAILEAIEAVEDKLQASRDVGFYYTGAIAGYGLLIGDPFYDSQENWHVPQVEWDTAIEDAKKYFYIGAAVQTIKNNQTGLPVDKLLKLAGVN